jgi:multiple sugar transport system permease protein
MGVLTILGRAFRWFFAVLAAVLVVWAFADVAVRWRDSADALAGRTPVRILYWGDNREREIMDTLVAAFEEANPDIDIQPLHAPDIDTKLKTMLAAGDPPDAFYLPAERLIGQLAEADLLLPLDDLYAAEQAANPEWIADFYPKLVDAFRWNHETNRTGSGTLYGLPKGFTTTVCYINADLFERAGVPIPYDGWTWDQYADAVAKITALSDPADPTGPIYGGVMQTWNWALRSQVWTFGGDYFGESFDDFTMDDPRVIEAFQYIVDRRFKDRTVYNATGVAQSEDELFRLGKVGVIGPLGRWKVPTYRQVDFRWDVVPMPTVDGSPPVTPIVTVSWAIARATPNPEATWRVVKFLCDAPGQKLIAELGLEIPSIRSVAESGSYHKPGDLPANSMLFLRQLDNARLIQYPLQDEFSRFVDEEIQGDALKRGLLSPEEAVARVKQRWNNLLTSPLGRPDLPPVQWGLVAAVCIGSVLVGFAVLFVIARRQKLGLLDRTEERTGWMFVLPWVLGFAVFTLGPMVLSLALSFTKWSATGPLSEAVGVGLGNYRELFTKDDSFDNSVWVTIYYTLLAVPITQIVAIAVALLMNLSVRAISLIRTIYFLPSVVAGVALVTLWVTIFDSSNGLLNNFLRPVLSPLGLSPPDWFGLDSKWWASPALVIMALWGVGGGMVIYLAGLKGVPKSLYEAAALDGAGKWRRFLNVTVPMISPIIFFQLIMAVIGSFQIFTQAYVMRGSAGGNNDLMFYVVNLYEQAFRFHNMGYASAMAWVLFVAILALTIVIFRGSRGMVHYEGLR